MRGDVVEQTPPKGAHMTKDAIAQLKIRLELYERRKLRHLAEAVGISQTHLSRLLHNHHTPSLPLALALAEKATLFTGVTYSPADFLPTTSTEN
jgi:transcriptional regulator with XRE-family HTH domain